MMKRKKRLCYDGRHTYFIIIAAVSLLCVAVALACFRYYIKLQETVKEESGNYLQEISKQIGVNAGKTIEDNFTILGTVATVLKSYGNSSFDELSAVVRDQRKYWNFERILVVDENGVAYDSHGHNVRLTEAEYLNEAIVDRKRSMSTSQVLDGKECVVFAIPLDGLVIDGTKMSALVASFDLTTFDKILSMTAFEGKGYGYIIRRDGTVVIRSSSPSAPNTGYNILSSFTDVPFAGKVGLEKVLTDISKGKAGQAELTFSGVPLYMSYTPLKTQEWYLLTFVPVAVANAKSKLFFNVTLLLCTFITLAFCALLSVIMVTSYRHNRKLQQIAYVDPVTGGNTIQCFYVKAGGLLEEFGFKHYALIYTNISKFKMLNEQLGRTACDDILLAALRSIEKDLAKDECIGRIFADNFCVLLSYEDEDNLAKRMMTWNDNYNLALHEEGGVWLPINVEFGVYVIDDPTLPMQDMIDRAKLALRETPHELGKQLHYTIYDEQVRCRLLREKQLEDMMANALEQREFEVYLQPKYCTDDENVGGAEALVRWNSPVCGMIFPDEFIALFEKNGFIIKLDLWVFEQVCKTISGWLKAGKTPVRVSVNCSRIHLKTLDFLKQYSNILNKYNIPPAFLEIELTENVLFEDIVQLTKTIDDIHELGLSCSMDDFGSGYSSLNLIQDIAVDVLKLDGIFFRSEKADISRTESVVGTIINMAHALSMKTVAEGVEARYHVDMLKRLGCDYIQGYYFARPMPIVDFEKLTFGEAIEPLKDSEVTTEVF
ncbi:MAG: EAL domain-containing protein [Hydrogenoanaerobacterium sp.]